MLECIRNMALKKNNAQEKTDSDMWRSSKTEGKNEHCKKEPVKTGTEPENLKSGVS